MSVDAMTAVFRHSESKGSARLVLLAMADEADGRGLLTAYRRSHSWLARKANVDGGTVRRAVATLVELGEVEILTKGHGRESSDYRLHLPGLEDPERVQDAPPAPASGTPTPGDVPPQGVQDAPPIIPLFPVDSPVSPSLPEASFDDFWATWPYKRGSKAEAQRQWPRAVKAAGGDPSVIVDGARRYAADPNLPDPQYIPHAVRWLRGERWNDAPLPARDGAPKRSTREQRIVGRPDGPARFAEALGFPGATSPDSRSLPPGETSP